MTDISMGQRSRSGRGVFADTGDQLLSIVLSMVIPSRFQDPTIQGVWGGLSPAISFPLVTFRTSVYDSGAMGWAIALKKIAHGLRTHV